MLSFDQHPFRWNKWLEIEELERSAARILEWSWSNIVAVQSVKVVRIVAWRDAAICL